MIEIMISIAILVVIVSLAAPSMMNFMSRNRIKVVAALFQDDLRQARYDSRDHGGKLVTFCSAENSANDASRDCTNTEKIHWGWLWITGNTLLGKSLPLETSRVQTCSVPFSLELRRGNLTIKDMNGNALPLPHVVTFIDSKDDCGSIPKINSVITFDQFGRTTVAHNI